MQRKNNATDPADQHCVVSHASRICESGLKGQHRFPWPLKHRIAVMQSCRDFKQNQHTSGWHANGLTPRPRIIFFF
jgi:hypothetical protein